MWTNEWGGKIIFAHGESNSRGVCVMFARNCPINIISAKRDMLGRTLIVYVKIAEVELAIVNIYAPNNDDPSFFINLKSFLEDQVENKLIMGDFNLVMDPSLDRYAPPDSTLPVLNNTHALTELLSLMELYMLNEPWRIRHPTKQRYSWFKNFTDMYASASRIDFSLCSRGLDTKIENITYIPGVLSDHCAHFCVINFHGKNERGKGYWKFNTQLLDDDKFMVNMRENLRPLCTDMNADLENPLNVWENIKEVITKTATAYARKRASERTVAISQLMEIIDDLQDSYPLNSSQQSILDNSIIDLNTLLAEETQRVIFRSKAKWYEEGEKNNKYFYSLERAKFNAKTCSTLIVGGKTYDTDCDILDQQREYFEKLYEVDQNVNFELTNSPVMLSEAQKETLSLPFSKEEIMSAIKDLKNNKTPGDDGLPAEVYKAFADLLVNPFYQLVNYAYEHEQLHTSALRGILNVIPKPGKDARYINNLRPITLLNVDYKIIEKMLTHRFSTVVPLLVHSDQRGFIAGRDIAVNIRKLLDIMDITEKRKEEAMVLSLDFSKAFDKISFSAIRGGLIYFGFPEFLVKWTEILYTNFQLRIQNNGKFSTYFNVNRGIHQGGVASATYFVLAAETMAQKIRECPDVAGIKVRDTDNKLNMFADDTDTLSLFQQKSIDAILRILSQLY